MEYKILLVEDDKLLRLGMKTLLEKRYSITEAINAQEAIDLIGEYTYHLIITDMMMPGGDGTQLLKYLISNQNRTDVMVISALGEEEDILKAYDLNIIDYIVKPVNFKILDKKILNIFKSKYGYTTEEILLDKQKYTIQINGEKYQLSEKEFEIVKLLTGFPNVVFSKYDLLNELWYGNMGMSEKIVEATISNLRTKLKEEKGLIKTKRGQGYYYEQNS